MKPLSLLLLIFLSACGIVQIEIRDKRTQTPQSVETKKEEPKRQQTTQKSPEEVKVFNQNTTLTVNAPVKGRAVRTERGYFISTSCGEFFRSVGDGRVLYAGDDIRSYGWVVMVEGDDGLVYVYGYAEGLLVKRGELVKKAQPLGKVGKASGGCGLLFEVRDREGRPLSFELVL